MNLFKNLFLCLILFALFSCNKENEDLFIGKAKGFQNGKKWKSEILIDANLNTKDSIAFFFYVYDKPFYLREQLHIQNIPLREGTYQVFESDNNTTNNLPTAKFFYLDYDVIEEVYNIEQEVPNNRLVIRELDEEERFISGEFNLSFISIRQNSTRPDRVDFENVEFELKY